MSDTTLTGMLTEDDFLEHYGVKGMKWGKRAAASVGAAVKEGMVRQYPNKARDAVIDKARSNINDGSNAKNIRAAKDAKKEAARALKAVRQKSAQDDFDANLTKTGKETVQAVLVGVGSLALATYIATRG